MMQQVLNNSGSPPLLVYNSCFLRYPEVIRKQSKRIHYRVRLLLSLLQHNQGYLLDEIDINVYWEKFGVNKVQRVNLFLKFRNPKQISRKERKRGMGFALQVKFWGRKTG